MRRLGCALALLCGCGTSPVTACEDVVDAVGVAFVRCGFGTPEAVESVAETEFGGCENIDDIRDIDELYEECIPAIRTLDCDDIEAGRVPASCENQFLIEI